ncbi:hypothetical protein [Methylobacterium sp. CM6257]
MPLNIHRFHKLLRLACHSGTGPNEAHNAAVLARKILLAEDMDIDSISVGPFAASSAHLRSELDIAISQLRASRERWQESLRECEKLRKECDELRAKNAQLEREKEAFASGMGALNEHVAALKEEFANLRDFYQQSDNGREYVSFEKFAEIAASRTGRKAWKAPVALALGLPIRELNAWSTVRLIPVDYMEQIESLDDTAFAPASRKAWTEKQIDEFQVVLEATDDDFQAALELTRVWRQPVYETSVTRQRRRLQRECRRAPGDFRQNFTSRV